MIYAVALGFDIESTERMRKKTIEIAESNINPYMVNNKITPHLTISLFETDDEFNAHKIFKYICLKVSRELVQICSIGTFEPKVVYYEPYKSDFLVVLNDVLTNTLIKIGIEPDQYYLPSRWVPHIALGVQLTSDELMRALKIVKKDFEPFNAIIEKVVLAKCNPYNEIDKYIVGA